MMMADDTKRKETRQIGSAMHAPDEEIQLHAATTRARNTLNYYFS